MAKRLGKDRAAEMMYSPGPMSGGAEIGRLEERLKELEKLAEELEGVPDSGVVNVLDRAVMILVEVNTRIEAGLVEAEDEVRKLDELLEKVDFGPFDAALEDLERPSDGQGEG